MELTGAQRVLGRVAMRLLCLTLVVTLVMMVVFAASMDYACQATFLLPNWLLLLLAAASIILVVRFISGGGTCLGDRRPSACDGSGRRHPDARPTCLPGRSLSLLRV